MSNVVTKQPEVLVVEANKPELMRPAMYQVVLINDDYTPMDFVVAILKEIFGMTEQQAIEVTLQVHNQGRGICGIYNREIAETKAHEVIACSRRNEYPLLCVMEIA